MCVRVCMCVCWAGWEAGQEGTSFSPERSYKSPSPPWALGSNHITILLLLSYCVFQK